MREARTKREELRRLALGECNKWDFAPTQWEAALCAELMDRVPVVVRRAPVEVLKEMRRRFNDCHANARWYVKNDPEGKSKVVTGWLCDWPNFVLHSVIEEYGQLVCVTPSHSNETEVLFIPDAEICWIEKDDHYCATRNGAEINVGVRPFPALTMEVNAITRERLLAGAEPNSACIISKAEGERLLRKHVDW